MEEVLLSELKGVGPTLTALLKKQGLLHVSDLLSYWPRTYQDFTTITPIAKLKPGSVCIEARINSVVGRYVRRGLHITEAVVSDASSSVRVVWFNQPYRAKALKRGVSYFIAGEFQLSAGRLAIMNPHTELVSDFPLSTARLVPIYKESKQLKSTQLRKLIAEVIKLPGVLAETLPTAVVGDEKLLDRAQAIRDMHFPTTLTALEAARRRIGFEEVFQLSLAAQLNKYANAREEALKIPFNQSSARAFVGALDFQLTNAQRKVIWRIYKDMQRSQPMNRLIEGDVGSGKTVVAAMAALMVLQADFQVALMAPTEILARQHAETMYQLLAHTPFANTVGLLVGSLKPSQKKEIHSRIADHSVRFLVGTHALIQEKVDMHRLGLVIIDEQHRFGVEQRKKLQAKAGHMPHVLSMTATPIPRSLALTVYGELDISLLDEMPAGRQPVTTKVWSPNARAQLYEKIEVELHAGRQAFVVCPLITDTDTKASLSVEAVHQQLSTTSFKHRRVGLLHGKLSAGDKESVMQRFVDHELDILVTTTVIEVGVDVPNATVMVIEGAERFGLAQIHQLRGRVGRGGHQAYCYLIQSDSRAVSKRLRAVEQSVNGFELAELDLQLRGAGALYGIRQSGQLDLRVANLSDSHLIAAARAAAEAFIERGEDLVQYPQLAAAINRIRAVTNLN